MRAPALIALAGLVFAAACSETTKTGLRVSVDPGAYTDAKSMNVVISAVPGGFVEMIPGNMIGAYVTIEDFDGDGAKDLVATFNGPFPNTLSFRVDTGNRETLAVHATAVAFDGNEDQVARGEGDGSLPAGSEGVVALTLMEQTSPVGAKTRTTDLKTLNADMTVNGPRVNAHLGPMAVCDLDGDDVGDLVLGAPDDDGTQELNGVGAVYVVFGTGAAATIDLLTSPVGKVVQFFGVESGDHLGTSVACGELNGDTFDDIVVGAPGAAIGRGRVYVIYGRTGLNTTTIDLTAQNLQNGASVRFATATLNASLGRVVHVADLDGDGRGEVLLAATGTPAKKVHIFGNLPASGSLTAIDTDAADHVVISGVTATALAAGDLDGTAPADVVIGDRNFIPSGSINAAGVVYVLPSIDPAVPRAIDIATTSPLLTLSGLTEGSLLGSSALVTDTSGRGADLLVAAPGDADRAGVIYLYQHEANFFLSPTRSKSDMMLTGPAAGGRFGESMAASGPAGGVRLIVGAPATLRGNRGSAGAAYAYTGSTARNFRLIDQVFGAAADDRLGTHVAGGLVNGDQIGDLVTAAPDAYGANSASGIVYVLVGK